MTSAIDALEPIAKRHDVDLDAAETVLRALVRGGGDQAQFSHPDLGGMGQWARGGGTMVGDMFDDRLKARVDALCHDLSDLLRETPDLARALHGSEPDRSEWWPRDLGPPGASGSQDGDAYAFFPEARRLAIQREGACELYDTGDHRISGVAQRQAGHRSVAFTSQRGAVDLRELRRVEQETAGSHREPGSADPAPTHPDVPRTGRREPEPHSAAKTTSLRAQSDVFEILERLHALQKKGIVTDAEFAEKKRELLARL